MELTRFIQQHIQLPEEMLELTDSFFLRKEYPKGELLLRVGNRSDKLLFIEQGLSRLFYIKDGKDITHQFYPEDHFYMPVESIFQQSPTPYGFELLEKSVVRVAKYSSIESHLDKNENLQKFVRYLMMNAVITLAGRLNTLQFQSAQERYSNMMKQYPDLILRAPLGQIASYLGITQQTLSVIRSGKHK